MKANINGKTLEVKVINANYNETMAEVKVLEGTFKGVCTVVNNNDLITEQKTTGKINFAKWEHDHRFLSVELELTNCEDASYFLDKFADNLGVVLNDCPVEEDNKYWDSFEIEYDHGTMTATKNHIKSEWKKFKKENGIR